MDFGDYAPVPKAEAARRAAAPAPAASSPAPAPPAVASAPTARTDPAGPLFVRDAERSAAFPLEHPISYGGRVYDAVILRRPSSVEVGRFFEELVEAVALDPGALVYMPVFVDGDGAPIPPIVLDALDDDDRLPIMARIADFLPRRLRALREAGNRASGPDTGEPTEPTSST